MNAPPITNFRPARRVHAINRQPVYLAAGGAACFGLVAFVVIAAGGVAGVDIDRPMASPEQRAVREYLDNNLPNPKYSEVEWSAPEPAWGGRSSIKLTYRTEGPMGAMSINYHRFYIKDGKVESRWRFR